MMKKKPIRFFLFVFAGPAVLATLWLSLSMGWSWPGAWLLTINLATLAMWGFDKIQSRRGGWRVPERCLHLFSIIGAVPASFIAMWSLRHKTLKPHFVLLYLAIFLVQFAIWFEWYGRHGQT
ncbi:MAG: DUF1294 domain-containing protein [Planctomycetes bacterium]|nr:DUF1294 domain-containing protein [Planctomycetota bacterium]